MLRETNQQNLRGASSVQESVLQIRLSIPRLSLQNLRALNRGEINLLPLTAFRQRSVLRFPRGPFQVARELQSPACA